ncbi:type II toxin-antitoxin system VapC family toxin [Amycolatopsis sp. lyj-112]|uniref:type II toxin-antitoxin system VapC family toxin n=1 Tax=Amycolatopsis sp. lyj-112 TaxID=2789288 RepID=UPI00397BF5C7
MSFLLDTNIVSEARRRTQNAGFARWWGDVSSSRLYLSALTVGEIERGIHKLRHRGDQDRERADVLADWLTGLSAQFSDRILPVTADVAAEWGRQCAPRKVPSIDGLIAATARVHGLTLVTRNLADMAGLGAQVHNPFE